MERHGDMAGSSLAAIDVAVLMVLVVAGGMYVLGAVHTRRDGRGWSHWRTLSFLTGVLLLAAGLIPAFVPAPHGTFQSHMVQHLFIAMLAPLALVLSAPVTLALRNVTPSTGRNLVALLRSSPVRLVANPITALLLNVGALYILYMTALYDLTMRIEVVHHLLHLHFFLAGYLFAWVIAGPDPGPHRLSVNARLTVLGVAIVAHSVLSQLMYANVFVRIPAERGDLQAGASLMYFGGDIAELLLALALLISLGRSRPPTPVTANSDTVATWRSGKKSSAQNVQPGSTAVVGKAALPDSK